jgi:predicted nucleic acid-binding protein
MAYLFDTDAISFVLRRQPPTTYLSWLEQVPRAEQFASAVTLGELYRGAFRASQAERHLRNIAERVLPALTILPYDDGTAAVYGRVAAALEQRGRRLADADLQIAATAIHHHLELVTGNVRHFARVPGLRIHPVLAETR